MKMVVDQLDEKSLAGSIAASIETMMQNAFFHLVDTDNLPVDGEALDVLNRLFAEAEGNACSAKGEQS